jgi:multidrug efflux system outer membrane protein
VPDKTRGEEGPAQAASLADQAWWDIFKDEALVHLVQESLEKGYDVRIAAWRVEEARALAGVARSDFYPQIQLDAGWSRNRLSGELVPNGRTQDLSTVDLGASWEIDLWGRIRRSSEAARARYFASEEARRGVLLTLVSDVARAYFELRELDRRLEIATRTRDAFQDSLNLFNRRLEGGAASALETASAEATLAPVAAAVPDLEIQIVAKENQLALLLGRPPGPIDRGAVLEDQYLPPEVPAGLPSDLIERRPDLREAEQELIAANADVGVATADMFPRFSLTADAGMRSPTLTNLISQGRAWSVGAGVLAPIFQGKRLHHLREAAVARWEQATAQYQQRVSSAFGEVSTALVAYQKLADVERELARAVDADRRAVDLSNERYVAGLSDYLEVLVARQQQLNAEINLAQTRRGRLTALVNLYKSLGGGWRLGDGEPH